MRFHHAKQVQSPVPWPAAGPTPTLSIPTLLPAVVLNVLVFDDAKHPSSAACLPQCQASQQHCIPTVVHNIPAPLPAFHTAQRAASQPCPFWSTTPQAAGGCGALPAPLVSSGRIWALQGQQHLWDAGS